MAKRYYAGIGSRETPKEILELMKRLAGRLAARGYVLRSGAADGADAAFEAGCNAAKGPKEIWLPWNGFNGHADTKLYPTDAHAEVAATVHPAWDRLKQGPKALHSRNIGQVLGMDLATPVDFVLCWTRDGAVDEASRTRDTGGTATAIVLASRWGIPVFNLNTDYGYDEFVKFTLAADREFHEDGSLPSNLFPQRKNVIVFGSNLAGRHGKGSALLAKEWFGAQPGKGEGIARGGRYGDSYAIPTKDGRPGTPNLRDPAATLSLADIQKSVNTFITYAKEHPDYHFHVMRLGCVLASHTDADIAPMFAKAPSNCSFAEPWRPWLGPRARVVPNRDASVSFSGTRVVHVKESKFDVYIGRQMGTGEQFAQSPWANPFKIEAGRTRDDVVKDYFNYIQTNPELLSRVGELKGKVLGCWCKSHDNPHALCHGDVLAALADGRPWSMPDAAQGSLF